MPGSDLPNEQPDGAQLTSLTSKSPAISASNLIKQLTPPPEFETSRFENYRPDPAYESQAAALLAARSFAEGAPKRAFGKKTEVSPGLYLDGGFGVGKTHLLASIWHAFRGAKLFGSFLEYTSLVGYLGFQNALEQLSKHALICIDEFELDDPGDTMIMSRLLKELSAKGVRFAATSNTPPNALGKGRFAAEDFKREIQGLGERFLILTIDGEDFRHRPVEAHSANLDEGSLRDWLSSKHRPALDSFNDLLHHLSTQHQTKYRALLEGVDALGVVGLRQLHDQVDALRWVAFIDRLYEQQIPLRTSGQVAATELFDETMVAGAYRKKYLRSVSRMGALTAL